MKSSVAIGKYTLESLTTGMYSNPRDLYREYIQNSVDSIDQAINLGLIPKDKNKIVIKIDKDKRYICIEDNGSGISNEDAIKKLLDIGNSSKVYTNNRGFRGIGRLAGLSYCDKLTFTTSAIEESVKTVISFDCMILRKLLIPGDYKEYDLSQVLEEVTTIKTLSESSKKHYFKVELESVEDIDGILNIDEMKDYLCQVAPLPFNKQTFKWGDEINNKFSMRGINISEYNIFINYTDHEEQLFKLCSDKYLADKFKRSVDFINDIEIRDIYDNTGNLQAVVWYGKSNLYGTILDESKKGLRLRKGNILIGDRNTLDSIFKEDRFNGWLQGEIYVAAPEIIPNARRDNFEKNHQYIYMMNKLTDIGNDLSKTIRSASSTRNDKNNKMLNAAESLIQKADKLLEEGFNSKKEKEVLSQELDKFKEDIESIDVKDEINLGRKFDLFKQLGMLTNNVKGATNFKILNISQKLTIDQKKTLEKVFEVLSESCDKDQADSLIGDIMKKFK